MPSERLVCREERHKMSGRINKEAVKNMLLLVIGALIYSVRTQALSCRPILRRAEQWYRPDDELCHRPAGGQDNASGEPAAAGSGLVLSKPPFRASDGGGLRYLFHYSGLRGGANLSGLPETG